MSGFSHISVLPAEVLHWLQPVKGGIYVDGTLGGGGHSGLILEALDGQGKLFGFDRDVTALKAASAALARFRESFTAINSNFSEMTEELGRFGIGAIDGFLLDLGVSSHQLDTPERGFSFQYDAPLDMRMEHDGEMTAANLVAEASHGELARIIREYGEEKWAGRIATFICKAREEHPIDTTFQLVDLIKGAIPRGAWEERIHPATRTFQALRIAVNDELGSLEKGLEAAVSMLKPGGRGVVISFHSLEDRIVKQLFRRLATGCVCPKGLAICACGQQPKAKVLTSKPVTAGSDELLANPRSRSAKLRALEKL